MDIKMKENIVCLVKEMKELKDIIEKRELRDDNSSYIVIFRKMRDELLESLNRLILLLEFENDWIDEEEYDIMVIAWEEIKKVSLDEFLKSTEREEK